MDKEQKKLYFKEILVTTIIIFSISLIIYIINYKPFELIGDAEVDQMLISMNRDDKIYFLLDDLALSFTAAMILVTLVESLMVYVLPVVEVNARLKEKEWFYIGSYSSMGIFPASPAYKFRFELEDGSEKVIPVNPAIYEIFAEGNRGILKYKGHIMRKFVEFYIESVD